MIERLRGERNRSIQTAARLALDVAERDSLIAEYKAEIERLRIERDTISKPLHVEIERLKAVLREVVRLYDEAQEDDYETYEMAKVARAALEDGK